PHGWRVHRQSGDVTYWTRPGKKVAAGLSATTGYCTGEDGRDLLYVFSSNAAPFEQGKSYSRFGAYTYLNHGGDFLAAARDLGARGYGDAPQNAQPKGDPDFAEVPLPPTEPEWPAPLRREAYQGLAGIVVEVIGPHSESDPTALLVSFLIGFGSMV